MMKFLGFLVVLAVIVLGVGYYLNWFQFSTKSQGDKGSVTLEVDKQKIEADKQKAQEKLKEFGGKIQDQTKGIGGQSKPANSESKDK
jgi:predicted negative regulator of RcsB-dependent stress response